MLRPGYTVHALAELYFLEKGIYFINPCGSLIIGEPF
jgi:hypothetical protein